MKVKSILFMANGNTAVFDEKGNQIGKLQKPWILLFKKMLQEQGVEDIDKIEIVMPDLRDARFEQDNWRIG